MADSSFGKDFGYLWPFFERLANHAKTADHPALGKAVAEAKAACDAVASLLEGGEAGPVESATGAEATAPIVLESETREPAATEPTPMPSVGSLFRSQRADR
ncbi:MAG: hypothetical protein KC502_21380 [Myxococcales bacterium]|nr:hypothetical protein [Myxococcales bacterium]